MSDRILVRTSSDLRHFLIAVTLVQDYVNQIFQQAARGSRAYDVAMTVEIPDDSLLFFATLFPQRATFIAAGEEPRRGDWDCVLDFRDANSLIGMAARTRKPILETVGITIGSNPADYPGLLFLSARLGHASVDVLLDEELDCSLLEEFLALNHPELKVERRNLRLRPANLFAALETGKLLVAKESGASYLAEAMGLGVVEVASGRWPGWWLGKPYAKHLRVAPAATPEMIWIGIEELCQTMGIFDTSCRSAASTAPPACIAVPVGEKSPSESTPRFAP